MEAGHLQEQALQTGRITLAVSDIHRDAGLCNIVLLSVLS